MSETRNTSTSLKGDIEKVAKGGSISLVGSIMGRGMFFILQIVIIRLFGAEVFGLYILGLGVARLVEVVSRFGLDIGSMKFVSICHKDDAARVKGTILGALGVSMGISILTGSFMYLGAGSIAEGFFGKPELKEVIRTFAFCIPFVSATFVAAAATLGFQTTRYSVYTKEIIQPTANLLLVLLFSFTSMGLKGVVYAFSISYLIAFVWSLYFLRELCSHSITERIKAVFETRNLLIYSIPLIFISFFNYLLVWTDILMIGHFLSSKDVSVYRAASLVPFLLTLVLNASNSIYAPVAADLFHKQQMDRLEEILKITTRWIFNITLPALILMIFFSRSIMLLFGAGFVENGVSVLIVLALVQFINCITGGVGATLVMAGLQKLEFLNSSLLVFLNIFLNYLFIPRYGAIGAAVASGIAIVFIKILRLLEVYYFYKIHPYNKEYLSGFVAAAMLTVILYLLDRVHILSGFTFFSLGLIATIVGTFFLTRIILRIIRAKDKYILSLLKIK